MNRPVIVTTEWRGVFFGYLASEDLDRRIVQLEKARNVIYWDAKCQGFGGLAIVGPIGESRIGALMPQITLPGVTSVVECTPKAVAEFEK